LKPLRLVVDVFKSSLNKWIIPAARKFNTWGLYHATSYWTFLGKEGAHKRSGNKKEKWCQTLLKFATQDLEAPFDELLSKGCSSFATELGPALRERLDNMERELRLQLGLDEPTCFREVLDSA
jgi:hypothetical protein